MKRILLIALLVLTGCEQKPPEGWLGYAEGENAFIAAPQSGWVSHIAVKRGDPVKVGDVLFTLDNTIQSASQEQSRAQIAQIEAQEDEARSNLAFAQKELGRQRGLAAAHAGTQAALDLAQSNYKSAEARLDQVSAQKLAAEAALTQSNYQRAQRDIAALTHGRVEDIYFRAGEFAATGAPVISVLPPENIFVRFFVPESELSKVKMGQKVKIVCDGCKAITATITFISQTEEFTPPVLFSIGNREKLVFKLEARADGGLPLNPGQPVNVRPL
ncbi:MAG: HlyD family efflux transporter periplasmic adaptor subunit [Alphaproteobacteria bacterium]|nr:HlyD family efflux transporter periplasmic adaptor subunit [Alphaproteobacteria bacterium]